jgi:hypothetical protein
MNDPIAQVIDRIQKNPAIAQAKRFTPNFLNNVGEVFEKYGFATTRQYLKDKANRDKLADQAKAVLAALDCMEDCESIRRHPAIGRLLIKTLTQIDHTNKSRQGGQK